jgi:hypothetical protein
MAFDSHQVVMAPLFNQDTPIEDKNEIGMLDRAHAVDDKKDRLALEFLGEVLANQVLGKPESNALVASSRINNRGRCSTAQAMATREGPALPRPLACCSPAKGS